MMKIFNAGLNITDLMYGEVPTEWTITASLIDSSGYFSCYDVLVGDVVYATGTNTGTGEYIVSRYLVKQIVEVVDSSNLKLLINWAEDTEEYCDPTIGMEALISRKLTTGLSFLTDTTNGVSIDFIIKARGLDSGYVTAKTFDVYTDEIIITNPSVKSYTLTYKPLDIDDVRVSMSAITLQRGINDDYIISEKTITFNDNFPISIDDKIVIVYPYLV